MEQDPFSESRSKSSKRALAQKNGRKKPGLKRPGELDTSGQLFNTFGISLPSNASRQEVFQAALKLSVTGGDFIDTRVYLFSRRTASGIVKRPRPVFVNSTVLRAMSPDLDTLLSGGFSESVISHLDPTFQPPDQYVSVEEYQYEFDSDLDDDDDDDSDDIQNTESCDLHKSNGRGHDESVMEPREEPAVPDDLKVTSESISSANWGQSAVGVSSGVNPQVGGNVGRTVVVKDMAYKTWQSLIFYIYTGQLEFAPLRSQIPAIRDVNGKATERNRSYQPPSCSPKSMYRLADKYGLKELKDLAVNDLKVKLSADNILAELFSPFTSWYSEIRDIEIEYLCNSGRQTAVLASIPQWLDNSVLASLIQKLANTSSTRCPHGCNSSFSRNCHSCGRHF
ncbi:hypothetical protein AcV7_004254 [Taiwanofungus camphoratus]|nr:hypothetical protein AcV7_004254 [Antrodia cinnamomea]